MEGTAGHHNHCFCTQDTGGTIVCCKCGMALTSCDECVIAYCPLRNTLKEVMTLIQIKAIAESKLMVYDCPLATQRYKEQWKAVAQ